MEVTIGQAARAAGVSVGERHNEFVGVIEAARLSKYGTSRARDVIRQWAQEDDNLPIEQQRARYSGGVLTVRLGTFLEFAKDKYKHRNS